MSPESGKSRNGGTNVPREVMEYGDGYALRDQPGVGTGLVRTRSTRR